MGMDHVRSFTDGKPDIGSGASAAANEASFRCFDDAYGMKGIKYCVGWWPDMTGIKNGVPRSPDVIAAEKEAAKERAWAREVYDFDRAWLRMNGRVYP